jgi:hypothetical protein
MPKPRRFQDSRGRGECKRGEDGEKVVDISYDTYDDAGGAAGLIAFAKWLTKASEWLTDKEDES